MNKKEREEMRKKIASVEQTVNILKLQETNLLEVIRLHPMDHPKQHEWVREIIIGCDYIVRLEKRVAIMKEMLDAGRKDGGKKKDE